MEKTDVSNIVEEVVRAAIDAQNEPLPMFEEAWTSDVVKVTPYSSKKFKGRIDSMKKMTMSDSAARTKARARGLCGKASFRGMAFYVDPIRKQQKKYNKHMVAALQQIYAYTAQAAEYKKRVSNLDARLAAMKTEYGLLGAEGGNKEDAAAPQPAAES